MYLFDQKHQAGPAGETHGMIKRVWDLGSGIGWTEGPWWYSEDL